MQERFIGLWFRKIIGYKCFIRIEICELIIYFRNIFSPPFFWLFFMRSNMAIVSESNDSHSVFFIRTGLAHNQLLRRPPLGTSQPRPPPPKANHDSLLPLHYYTEACLVKFGVTPILASSCTIVKRCFFSLL